MLSCYIDAKVVTLTIQLGALCSLTLQDDSMPRQVRELGNVILVDLAAIDDVCNTFIPGLSPDFFGRH